MFEKVKKLFLLRQDELIIFASAFAVRFISYLNVRSSFLFQNPMLDAKYYFDWAGEIAKGDYLSLGQGVFTMSPGYSYFLALIFKIIGFAVDYAVIAQVLLSSAAAVLVYKIARRFVSRNLSIAAGLVFSFYAVSVFYDLMILKGSLYQSLSIGLIFLFIKYFETGKSVFVFSAGLLIGLLVQLRPYALLMLPLCVVFCLYCHRPGARLAKTLAALIAGFLIFTAPVALRNYRAGGELVLSTAHGGMNLYTGNNIHSKGPYTPLPFARTDPKYEQLDFLEQARRSAGRELTPAEADRFWYSEAFNFITGQPLRWLKLMGRKTLIFFNNYEPPINIDYYFFKDYHGLNYFNILISFSLIAAFGTAGVFMLPKYNKNALFLISYLGLYFLSNIIFFAVSEYRYPAVPVFIVFSAVFFEHTIRKIHSKRVSSAALAFGLAVLLLAVFNADIYSGFFGLRTYKKANLANSYFGLGYTYEENNMVPEAIKAYNRSIEIMPQDSSLVNLSSIYSRSGNLDQAKEYLLFAIRIKPNSYEAHNNLGSIYYAQGDYEAAYGAFETAHRLYPYSETVKNNMLRAKEKIR